MSTKVSEKLGLRNEAGGCLHHWLIEGARGATSRGACKYCGEERTYYNSWTDFNVMKRSVKPNVIDELFDTEPEPETEKPELEKVHAGV